MAQWLVRVFHCLREFHAYIQCALVKFIPIPFPPAPLLFLPPTMFHFQLHLIFFLFNPLSSLSAACMCLTIGPWRKLILSPPAGINANSFMARGGTSWALPHPCLDFDWLDLVQAGLFRAHDLGGWEVPCAENWRARKLPLSFCLCLSTESN